VKRTSARLADGREIIYFDEADDAVRVLHDPRTLPVTATASEVRYDAVLDEWVGIASHRQDRTHLPPTHECPLCPSTPERATEIPSPT
jgi:UDPglucose--hexose-1-phosphate uridylyltransferase